MTRLIAFSGIALSLVSFVGYVFITNYYLFFGVNVRSSGFSDFQLIVNGIGGILSSLWFSGLLVVACVTIALGTLQFRVRVYSQSIHISVLTAVVVSCLSIPGYFVARGAAQTIATRDLFYDTTALSQLACIGTMDDGEFVRNGMFDRRRERLILLLVTQDEIVLFSAPTIRKGNPKPTVYHISRNTIEVLIHANATLHPSIARFSGPCER